MEASTSKQKDVEDSETQYILAKKVTSFWKHINLYGIGDEGDFILELCLEKEQANMIVPTNSSHP